MKNADVGKEPGAAEGDGVGAAREGSVDSEGFLLREDHAKDGGVSRWARLVNVHHDHNRDELRACTVFVYLSDVEPIAGPADDADETERRKTPGGGTFFPCVMGDVDPREGDDVRARLALHGKRGTHVIFHDSRDGGAEEEASEGDALVAEFGTLSRGGVGRRRLGRLGRRGCGSGRGLRRRGDDGDHGRVRGQVRGCLRVGAAPAQGRVPESMRGTILEGNGVPGLLIRPREGRAVVFWHGEDAGSCPEAWHAPLAWRRARATSGSSPLRCRSGAKPKLKQATEETIMPGGLDPYAAVMAASRGTLDSVNMVNIHGTQMIQPVRKNDDATTAARWRRSGAARAWRWAIYPARNSRLQLGPGSEPAGAQGNTLTGLPGLSNNVPGKSLSQWKQKWCCLVDDCFTPAKTAQ